VTDAEIARILSLVAQDLDDRMHPGAGILRVAARRILELSFGRTTEPARRCLGCGEALPPPAATGRPRRWCGRGRCEKRAKTRRFGEVIDDEGRP
jgi:hypothetical protein